MEEFTYHTLARVGHSHHRVLGSRHLGYAFPVKDENHVRACLGELANEHPQATHICYAWRLGWDMRAWRLNDDGEPSGTAGKPIFGQIESHRLTHALVAVVRYFGGTKLGTGGLVDAYRTAAREAIADAGIEQRRVRDRYLLTFPAVLLPEVMRQLKSWDMEDRELDQGESCSLRFTLDADKRMRVEEWASGLPGCDLQHIGRN